eukprot:6188261-Pleurochrysis_carterae.AAC.2
MRTDPSKEISEGDLGYQRGEAISQQHAASDLLQLVYFAPVSVYSPGDPDELTVFDSDSTHRDGIRFIVGQARAASTARLARILSRSALVAR